MVVLLALERPFRFKSLILQSIVYSIGALLPYAFTVLLLKWAGSFDKFWFWTFTYASKYASGMSLKNGLVNFKQSFGPMWQEFSFFWMLFLAGLLVLFLTKFSWKQKLESILFCLFSILSVCPGLYFRQHYFICTLPAVGLLSGITLSYLSEKAVQLTKLRFLTISPAIIYVISFLIIVSQKNDYYLNPDGEEISKKVYGANPFVESQVMGDYIKEHSNPNDKIAVLGSEPQIYFLANRHSATGYIYTYALMERQSYNKTMQQQMITEIEGNKPLYLMFCNISTSWLRRPDSPTLIFDWFNSYVKKYYTLVGIADISNFSTTYKWDADALTYKPQTDNNVYVFKRKM